MAYYRPPFIYPQNYTYIPNIPNIPKIKQYVEI